jgi:hypothetical protein
MLQWMQESPLYVGLDASAVGFLLYKTGMLFRLEMPM